MAIALFAVLVLVVLVPMTGLFGLTRQSLRQTDVTGSAQAILEDVRGQWQNWQKYDNACVSGSTPDFPVSAGVTAAVSMQALTAQGGTSGSASSLTRSTTCTSGAGNVRPTAAPSASPALRRITVTATAQGRTSTLITEVARP